MDAAADDANAAADELDTCNAVLEAAEGRADAARELLWVAEQEAAWSRAVAVLARLRAAKRRSLKLEEVHDMVLVVDEEEVFAMPEDPAGVLALSGVTGDGAALEEEPLSHPAEGQEGSACVVPTEILKGSVLWVRQHHRSEGGGGLDGGGDDGGAWRQFDPGGRRGKRGVGIGGEGFVIV